MRDGHVSPESLLRCSRHVLYWCPTGKGGHFPGKVVGQADEQQYMLSVVQQAKDQAWREKVEEEVVRQAGPAAAQMLMAMLSFRPSRRPTAAQALQLPYFRQQPLDMPQADGVSCGHYCDLRLCYRSRSQRSNSSRATGAGAAQPSQAQDGPSSSSQPLPIPPATSLLATSLPATLPPATPFLANPPSCHVTCSAHSTSDLTSNPICSSVSDEDSAAIRSCSGQVEEAFSINIAARAGQGLSSSAAMLGITSDSNAASTDDRAFTCASLSRRLDACPKTSKLHETQPQTVHAAPADPGRKKWGLGAASHKAAQLATGVAGWVRGQAQAHPKVTIAVAAVTCCALGLLARRQR